MTDRPNSSRKAIAEFSKRKLARGCKEEMMTRARPHLMEDFHLMETAMRIRPRRVWRLLLLVTLLALPPSAWAQDWMQPVTVDPDALVWKDNPTLPKGAETTVVAGDPSKPEMFVVRAKWPPNYRIPPHTHPNVEMVTVLAGTVFVAEGDKVDTGKGKMMKAGSFYAMPVGHPHYVWTGSEGATVQVQSIGPSAIEYVNPADDPRTQQ
jgi:quercetin dioxygenase-like cupin family protein